MDQTHIYPGIGQHQLSTFTADSWPGLKHELSQC